MTSKALFDVVNVNFNNKTLREAEKEWMESQLKAMQNSAERTPDRFNEPATSNTGDSSVSQNISNCK